MKGDASTHVYTDKGRENHDRIFGKKTKDEEKKTK